MKKHLSLLAIFTLCAMLASCGSDPATSTASSGSTTSTETSTATSDIFNETGFPIVNEPVTLKVWGPETIQGDYNTLLSTTYYEEMTGVHIEWDQYSSTMDGNEAFNLLIASGDLPDIMGSGYSTEQVAMCIEGDIVIPLNDLIDKYGTNFQKALEEQPQYVDMLTAPDGNIYNFMYTDVGVHKDSEYKMWVYTDWLEKLNMEAPTTPEEFKEMLIAFKEQDPNGNGQADELGLVGFYNGRQSDPICYLMNAFELYNTNYYTITDDKKINFVANTDGWRDGLRYLNDLYESGLIEEETYVQDKTQFQALLNKPAGETIVGTFPFWYQGDAIDTSVLKWTDYQAIAPLKGPTGLQQTAARKGGGFALNNMITTKCEYPEVAFRWLDYLVSEEGNFFTQFGVEGETYEWVDQPAFNGSDKALKATKENVSGTILWNSGYFPRYDSVDVRYATVDDEALRDTDNTYVLYSAAKIYEPYYVWHNIPDVVWNSDADIANAKADYQVSFNEYIAATDTAFVLGNLDIDNDADWQNYLDTLNSMGLDQYIETLEKFYGLTE
ncbi:MAG: hypothetical protein ACOX6P_05595 [Candidatus Merdivicinus sp.]|jgi:putative aldouronate transport system substrate-binding protein